MSVKPAYHAAAAEPATRRRLGATVAASLAGKGAEMVTLLLLATVVPRALGPSDYGRFAVPLTLVTVGSLALTLGGPTVMARFVPAAPPVERVALARAIGGRLARGRAAQLAVISGGALVAVAAAPTRFPPLETGLVVAALVVNVATSLALQTTLGLGRTMAWSLRYPVQNAVLIAAVLVLHPVAGVTGAVVAILLSSVAGAGMAAAAAWTVVARRTPPVPVPPGAVRFGALHAAGAALVQFAHRGGVLAVALLAGSSTETGFAALAVGIALGATYAVLQAFTVSLPLVTPTAAPASTREAGAAPMEAGALVSAVRTVAPALAVPVASARAAGTAAMEAGHLVGAARAGNPALAVPLGSDRAAAAAAIEGGDIVGVVRAGDPTAVVLPLGSDRPAGGVANEPGDIVGGVRAGDPAAVSVDSASGVEASHISGAGGGGPLHVGLGAGVGVPVRLGSAAGSGRSAGAGGVGASEIAGAAGDADGSEWAGGHGAWSRGPGSARVAVPSDSAEVGGARDIDRGGVGEGEAALRRLAAGLLAVLVPVAAGVALVLDAVVPAVFGRGYEGAIEAFGPALALVVLAPLNALAVQVAALRLRPEAALASGVASALGFVVVAVGTVPAWGAAGGTAAALAGAAAGAATSLRLLPGFAGRPIGLASFAGAAVVLALAVLT